MAQQNPLVSQGTCYYAAGKEANSVYIPCGNAAFGVYACCMNGDTCLSSDACYNAEYGDTYIAGCTDPTYSHSNCGNKGAYGEQQWTSLVRCFVSNDTTTNDEEWAACSESRQPVVTQHDGGCVCTSSSDYVFRDNPHLTNHAVLPAATGQSISFELGYTPPSDLTPTAQATSSSSAETSTISSSASASSAAVSSSADSLASTSPVSSFSSSSISSLSSTSTSTPVTSTTHSLSAGAGAGIGLGAALFVLIICGLIFFLYRRRARNRRTNHDKVMQDAFVSPYTDSNSGWSFQRQSQYAYEHSAGAGAPAAMHSPVWLANGFKPSGQEHASLMGRRPPSELASQSYISEIEGSPSVTQTSTDSLSRSSNSLLSPLNTEPSYDGTWKGSRILPHSQSRMTPGMETVYELPGSHT